jgi:hypothetical protein
MKTVKMRGGLGNQLFCLAFARSVARLEKAPAAIDLAGFGADRYGRTFDLEDLAVSLGDIRLVRRPLTGGRLAAGLSRVLPLPGYVNEGPSPVDEGSLAALVARGDYFNGYWQHERYISDPGSYVAAARAFVFQRAAPAAVREVVIHYRTYKEEARPEHRRGPDGDYVRRALARIESRLGKAREVCLVSDDPCLAMRRLGDLGRNITVVDAGGAWNDMALLMKARTLVLTNSSFSWWGGYCGDAAVTTYPRRLGFFHYPAPAARFDCL